MDNSKPEDTALFRYGIIAPLVSGTVDKDISNRQFFMEASEKIYEDPQGKAVKVSWYTIARWYDIYRKEGFDGLKPKERSDKAKHRKADEDILKQINYLISEYPRLPATLVYQKLQDNGTITADDLSLSTITRIVSRIKKSNGTDVIKEMRRYEREHINEVWCGDSSHGPYIKIDGKKHQTFIIALIDDASRYVVGIDIFLNDNFVNLMSVIKSAVRRNGKPKVFNFDNGSNYKCKQMTLLAARMGSTISYCSPYTPTAKAKIERWFRTLKDHWMSSLNMNDYKTLQELRRSLFAYVQQYNQSPHKSLDGKSPQDRFFNESSSIIRIDDDTIEKTFLLEIERRVSKDNVVMIDQIEYEVDYHYAGQRILLRYSPDLSKIYVVDKDTGELKEIHLLDKKANSKVKRTKVKYTEVH